MGSVMDSRYWVCPDCCRQFDWEKEPDLIETHSCSAGKRRKAEEKAPEHSPPATIWDSLEKTHAHGIRLLSKKDRSTPHK